MAPSTSNPSSCLRSRDRARWGGGGAPDPPRAADAIEPRGRFGTVAIHAALFLGGAAALAYETAWGRMLHRVLGISDFAVAAVLAASSQSSRCWNS